MANHYETLGVAKDATQEEIKNAYRKLAMQYHPDRNQGNKAAEEKFKSINEAYETLSDTDKRNMYDYSGHNNGGNPFGQHFAHGFPPNIDDIFKEIFGNNSPFRQQPQRNRDISLTLTMSLEEAYFGKQMPIQFNDSVGNTVSLNISVPPGVESGNQMRFSGHGDKQHSNLPAGDLYIVIQILEHNRFSRNGANLYLTTKINALDAIVGKTIDITCIDNNTVKVKIPPGTQPNTKLNVKSKGMPIRSNQNVKGDLIIEVLIDIPTNLTEDDLNAIKRIINK